MRKILDSLFSRFKPEPAPPARPINKPREFMAARHKPVPDLTPKQEAGLKALGQLRGVREPGTRMLPPRVSSAPPVVIHPDDMDGLCNHMRH